LIESKQLFGVLKKNKVSNVFGPYLN